MAAAALLNATMTRLLRACVLDVVASQVEHVSSLSLYCARHVFDEGSAACDLGGVQLYLISSYLILG